MNLVLDRIDDIEGIRENGSELRKKPFENNVGQGENAGNHYVFYHMENRLNFFS